MISRISLAIAFLCITHLPAMAQDKFDPKDAKKSGEWINGLWHPYFQAIKDRNDVAKKNALSMMDAAIRKEIVGKEVDWTVMVESVGSGGVHFKYLADTKFNNKRLGVTTAPFSAVKPKGRQIGSHAFIATGDWVAKLKARDEVQLQGKIVSFRWDVGNSPGITQIMFGDYKVSLPAKK